MTLIVPCRGWCKDLQWLYFWCSFAIFVLACGIVVFQNYKQFSVFTNLVNFDVLYMVCVFPCGFAVFKPPPYTLLLVAQHPTGIMLRVWFLPETLKAFQLSSFTDYQATIIYVIHPRVHSMPFHPSCMMHITLLCAEWSIVQSRLTHLLAGFALSGSTFDPTVCTLLW